MSTAPRKVNKLFGFLSKEIEGPFILVLKNKEDAFEFITNIPQEHCAQALREAAEMADEQGGEVSDLTSGPSGKEN